MKINTFLDVDVVAIENDDTVTVMIDIQAPEAPQNPDAPRPEHTAIVVLDRSGSMSGGRLEAAKRALIDLVARLDDRDTFGLVTFDSQAEIVIPAGRVAELGRERIHRRIAAVRTGGSTDLSSGYLRGLSEAQRAAGAAGATIVLLSDGHANAGITDPKALRDLAAGAGAQTITTSTIGLGHGYDQDLLAEIATGGNGNHSFAVDGDAAAAALAGEIEGLLNKTVQAASLLIRPTNDVATVSILNDLPIHAVQGGLLVELGDFYSSENRRLLISFAVPAMAALGLAQIADLEMSYVELPALRQHTVRVPISVNVVPADLAAERVPAPEVHAERMILTAQQAKRASEEALAAGDFQAAQASLDGAITHFAAMAPADLTGDAASELDWLRTTREGLDHWDSAYTSKRLRSDRSRKHRGYRTREQGGEKGPHGTSERGSVEESQR